MSFPSSSSARDLILILLSSYFTTDGHQGVSIFRRRETSEEGHRGFRLSSLGVLLAKSSRPRPWRHVPSLKSLFRSMYSRFQGEGIYDPGQFDWSSAESFFEQRKDSQIDSPGSGTWRGWSDELDLVSANTVFFSTEHVMYTGLTPRSSLIQISTIPPPTYPTFFVFLDSRPSRCTNTFSVAGEF
jgi:hypothetical protein